MKIGIPKEIKAQEQRIGAAPITVANLIQAGHEVIIESGAGVGSGYPDEAYEEFGAKIGSVEDVWDCEMIIKVKEPLPEEYKYFRPGSLFTPTSTLQQIGD